MRIRESVAIGLVVVVLAAIYAPVLQARYYMRDEFLMVSDAPASVLSALYIGLFLGWKNARPLAYPFYGLYTWIDALGGLFWIRVSQILASVAAAVLFFGLLRRRNVATVTAALVVVLLWSQPAVAIYSVYCPMSPYWVGVCGGWFAFEMVRHGVPRAWSDRRRLVGAALLLFAGWLTFQAAPFGVLVPASFYALTASRSSWDEDRRAIRVVIGLLVATMLGYVGFTKLTLSVSAVQLTSPVRRAFSLLWGAPAEEYRRLLDPLTWLLPFEWWNYPWPTAAWPADRLLWWAGASACAWLMALGSALAIELRTGERGAVWSRYAYAAAAIGATFLPVALEGLEGLERQHVMVACVPAIVLSLLHALTIVGRAISISPRVSRAGWIGAAAVVAVVAVGARAGIARGVVEPHARALGFVEAALERSRAAPAAAVVVVNVQEEPCLIAPCHGLFGRTAWSVTRSGYQRFFRRLAQEHGHPPNLPVTFRSANDAGGADAPGTLLVDFRRFRQRALAARP